MNKLKQIGYGVFDFVDGYKTYLVAIVMAVLNLGVAVGWIAPDHIDQINLVLAALGLGAIKSAIKKI